MSHLRFNSTDFDMYDSFARAMQRAIENKACLDFGLSPLNLIAEDVEYEDVSESECEMIETSEDE